MSAVVIMVPALMGGPAFAAAVAVAGAALGLQAVAAAAALDQEETVEENTVEVGIPHSHALSETVAEGEVMTLGGNGFTVHFEKTPRGECQMRVCGEGKSKAELEKLGRDLLAKVAQQYAYQRLTQELKKKGYSLVQEKVEADQTIRLVVQKWK